MKPEKEGKISFIGFSAHSVEAATAMMDRFDFDTIIFPVNFVTWNAGNFGPQVLEMAHQKKMGILALKSMARTVHGRRVQINPPTPNAGTSLSKALKI